MGKIVSSADKEDPRMKTTTTTMKTPTDSELRGCGWIGLGPCARGCECVILWAGGHRVLTTMCLC